MNRTKKTGFGLSLTIATINVEVSYWMRREREGRAGRRD